MADRLPMLLLPAHCLRVWQEKLMCCVGRLLLPAQAQATTLLSSLSLARQRLMQVLTFRPAVQTRPSQLSRLPSAPDNGVLSQEQAVALRMHRTQQRNLQVLPERAIRCAGP